jgi:ribokinase
LPKLVNLGSLNIDHVIRLARFPRPGETVSGRDWRRFPGGKGFNQSLAAARAGARVCHFGCIGPDGEWLREALANAAVDVSGIRTLPDADTGRAIVQVDEAGENAIVVVPGANQRLDRSDVEAALSALGDGDWLLLQNEINGLEEVLKVAKKCSARIALNLAPADDGARDYDLSAVSLLIVNEIEARTLSGVSGSPEVLLDALCVAWQTCNVVVTLGRHGLQHGCGRERGRLPAFPVAAVDSTAAGDAFVGYLLASLLGGQALETALARASAAGALAVTRRGAGASIPEQGAVATLLRTGSVR